ncbi:bestrophin-1 isoform X2 [Periophthalmus magnuspinnatus]|uniref:bestrophin-1 isoform X2 n=1 Tax=Periophthalmus magnuspinnatus TaxID=409849 RepID=UPI002436746A|nr:bestrophin-1 isoform X2 [Periophthalmus magnuspinnatus]
MKWHSLHAEQITTSSDRRYRSPVAQLFTPDFLCTFSPDHFHAPHQSNDTVSTDQAEMTVTYSRRVADAGLGTFFHLLLRWKGSIYKLLYRELIIFTILYYFFSVVYRNILNDDQKRQFEKLSIYCDRYAELIPVSFVLGFYVTLVVSRWWGQYENIPWPDRLAALVGAHVRGADEMSKLTRRTLMRYANLSGVLTYRSVSTAVYKRFPTMEHLVQAGLMTSDELRHLDSLPSPHNKFWVPCMWFVNLALRARTEGRINNDVALTAILTVATVAVYSFFLACLIGRQFLDPAQGYPGHDIDFYLPIFTLLQFFFYVGWLKVAEQLINPFGEDDDDFETNWVVDRNLQVSLLSVDEMYDSLPLVEKDMYWNETEPQPPYTAASAEHRKPSFMGSALDISVPKEEMEFQSNLEQIKENEETNYSTPLLGGLGRLLGVQSPNFPRSSRVSLLRRRPGAPLSRFPLYLHPEAPSTPGQGRHLLNPESEFALSALPPFDRSGFYSCPQTPIHCVPPAFPRPRPARRAQNEWDRSCNSLAPPVQGSQQVPPDTPNHALQPPSSAFPWLGGDSEVPSGPAFSFPDPAPELSPISKIRHGLLSRRPPARLTLDTATPMDIQTAPSSARTTGSERVFSFTPPSRSANPSNPSSSTTSINAAISNSAGTTGSLCNGTNHSSFNNSFSSNMRASNGGANGGLSNIVNTVSSAQQEANQQNSPNDSGISLADGDLLGVLVDNGVNKAGAKERE